MPISNTTSQNPLTMLGEAGNAPAQADPNDTLGQNSSVSEPNEDGSVDVDFSDSEINDLLNNSDDGQEPEDFYENLVSKFHNDDLLKIAEDVLDSADSDEETREEWMRTLTKGMRMLGTGIEEVNEPFEGACGASHPLILEASVKFQSKASSELLPSGGPVRTQVMGTSSDQLEQQATRVRDHMNWQVTTQMTEYYPDKERMLMYLPQIGSVFTKSYYSAALGRNCSEMVPVDQFIVSNNATDLERASRYTHVIFKTKNELKKDVAFGMYEIDDFDEDLGAPKQIEWSDFQTQQSRLQGIGQNATDFDAAYTLYEQHVDMFFEEVDEDEDEVAKPYIITVEKNSNKVIGIRRNWEEGDKHYKKIVYFTHYTFVPGTGFYGLGYIHLLGNINVTLTSALRALVDAGQFANLPAGFKTANIRVTKDESPLKPGEWRDIETAGQKLAEAFVPAPYKEPSQTLFNLLTYLEGRGQQFADSTDAVVADSTNYGPVGTTMALLDASTKFFSAIHKRLHFAQKKELQILFRLNSMFLDEDQEYNIPGQTLRISAQDYMDRIDVVPVSDPNISSNAQRIALEGTKVQIVQQMGAQSYVNMNELLRRQFLALGEKDIDKLVPPPAQAQPQGPVEDLVAAVKGQPIAAFPGQNHQAHVQVKTAWLQDPANGANQVMAAFVPIVQANIQEHMIMDYQEKIAGAMQNSGVQITGAATDQQTVEMVIGKAAQQVMQANQAAAQQQQQGSPESQIAQAEMIKATTAATAQDHQQKKDFATLAQNAQKIQLEAIKEANRMKLAGQAQASDLTKQKMNIGADLVKTSLGNMQDAAKTTHMTNTQVVLARQKQNKVN